MPNRAQKIFLLLILAHGLHSTEEYIGRLWDVLPPTRFVSGLVSNDLERGFIILTLGIFIVGILSWILAFRKGRLHAPGLIWFWTVIEIINGLAHPLWCLIEERYVPGVITAPLLLLLGILLSRDLLRLQKNFD